MSALDFDFCEAITWGDLPALRLRHPAGAQAIITLYGAHLVQWISADGRSHLFCSELSSRDGQRAIRGGVPVIFPQFASRGDGLRHGFARLANWQHYAQGAHDETRFWAELSLTHADLPANLGWQHQGKPHEFELRLNVTISAQTLEMRLTVRNTGQTPFQFGTALHSYWQLANLATCQIDGLGDTLRIERKIDQIFHRIHQPVTLQQENGRLQISLTRGFQDVVVWNPGADDAAALADLADHEYRQFVCIEAANVDMQTLAAGASWRAEQMVTACDQGQVAKPHAT